MHRATPPNEVEEDVPIPPVTATSDDSPTDTDGSHSYHEESQPAYAHQSTYPDMSVNPALGVAPTPEMKDDMTSLLQSDSLRKDFIPQPSVMDPTLMNQNWGYQ